MDDPDLLAAWSRRLLETSLRDFAGSKNISATTAGPSAIMSERFASVPPICAAGDGEQPAMPKRVIRSPFMAIKLKKAPPGLARTFPSEIRTAQAAIKFVNSLDPRTRAKLHWKLAASALAALDTGAIRQGAYDRANKAVRNALTTEGWLAE